MVPVLISSQVGLSQRQASGTSLAAILPIALAGALTYQHGGAVDVVATAAIVAGSVVGAAAGAQLSTVVPERRLRFGFALFTLAVAIRLAVPVALPESHGSTGTGVAEILGLVALGAVAGLLSGLLGIGGGVVIVPLLVLGFGLSQQVAQGTSLLAIVPTGLTGALAHGRLGNVVMRAAVTLGIAGVVGALAGAVLAVRVPEGPLRTGFAAYLGVVALHLLVQLRRSGSPTPEATGYAGEPPDPRPHEEPDGGAAHAE